MQNIAGTAGAGLARPTQAAGQRVAGSDPKLVTPGPRNRSSNPWTVTSLSSLPLCRSGGKRTTTSRKGNLGTCQGPPGLLAPTVGGGTHRAHAPHPQGLPSTSPPPCGLRPHSWSPHLLPVLFLTLHELGQAAPSEHLGRDLNLCPQHKPCEQTEPCGGPLGD